MQTRKSSRCVSLTSPFRASANFASSSAHPPCLPTFTIPNTPLGKLPPAHLLRHLPVSTVRRRSSARNPRRKPSRSCRWARSRARRAGGTSASTLATSRRVRLPRLGAFLLSSPSSSSRMLTLRRLKLRSHKWRLLRCASSALDLRYHRRFPWRHRRYRSRSPRPARLDSQVGPQVEEVRSLRPSRSGQQEAHPLRVRATSSGVVQGRCLRRVAQEGSHRRSSSRRRRDHWTHHTLRQEVGPQGRRAQVGRGGQQQQGREATSRRRWQAGHDARWSQGRGGDQEGQDQEGEERAEEQPAEQEEPERLRRARRRRRWTRRQRRTGWREGWGRRKGWSRSWEVGLSSQRFFASLALVFSFPRLALHSLVALGLTLLTQRPNLSSRMCFTRASFGGHSIILSLSPPSSPSFAPRLVSSSLELYGIYGIDFHDSRLSTLALALPVLPPPTSRSPVILPSRPHLVVVGLHRQGR